MILRIHPLMRHLRKSCRRLEKAPAVSLAGDLTQVEGEEDSGQEEEKPEGVSPDVSAEEEEFDPEAEDAVGFGMEEEEEDTAEKQRPENAMDSAQSSLGVRKEKSPPSRKDGQKENTMEDGFFDWDEMEKFAEEDEMEELGGKSDEEDENGVAFPEGETDEEESEEDLEGDLFEKSASAAPEQIPEEMRYSDFFGGPEKISKQEPSTHEVEGKDLSSHEQQKLEIAAQIDELEQEALAEKPWVMKGEAKAGDRPENSLLEVAVDVDRQVHSAPQVTEESTATLEEIIIKRILDENYDDVVPKVAPKIEGRNDLPEVSMEKSKQGLGEIYEKEYLRQVMGVEDEDPRKEDKEEMARLFKKLCYKLDALSNFHFTPKPVLPDVQVKINVPSIAMEEVLPMSVSATDALAPEEMYEKKKGREGVLQSTEEMDKETRKRTRAGKKAARRKAKRQKENDKKLVAKINPGLGNPYEKEKILESLKSKNVISTTVKGNNDESIKTSAKFFKQLQEQTTREISTAASSKLDSKKSKKIKIGSKSANLKL